MGVDAADYDRSGYPSVIITNFANQMVSLYHNERNGLFVDEAPQSDVGHATLLTLGFGCFFFDYDLDGWPDIYIADGHIEDAIERVQQRVHYAEPPHLFRNLGNGKFEDVTSSGGSRVRSASRRSRRRLWRHQQRRRARSSDLHERRPGAAVPQQRRDESQPAHQARRHEIESRRHRLGGEA